MQKIMRLCSSWIEDKDEKKRLSHISQFPIGWAKGPLLLGQTHLVLPIHQSLCLSREAQHAQACPAPEPLKPTTQRRQEREDLRRGDHVGQVVLKLACQSCQSRFSEPAVICQTKGTADCCAENVWSSVSVKNRTGRAIVSLMPVLFWQLCQQFSFLF
ncbi:hypothetical protein SRHO_G00055320 [Serrasalmus rhombeus]